MSIGSWFQDTLKDGLAKGGALLKFLGFDNAADSYVNTGKFASNFLNVLPDNLLINKVTQGLSPSSASDGSTLDNFARETFNYLDGLMASQGAEAEKNRVYNSAEALANREFQSAEAQLQRDWYESMSNSAYQRAVHDMKAAGINPILAYSQGGAASSATGLPSSSAASLNAVGGDTLSSILTALADVLGSVSSASSRKFNDSLKLSERIINSFRVNDYNAGSGKSLVLK